ncbi:MAG TPA: PQQ-binding-like beta-propeller repeat protein [Polyangiaceae bacterium]|nr:PQQ-binding-like beta-propeller repeat protein [Polyangiaceae bacterium]
MKFLARLVAPLIVLAGLGSASTSAGGTESARVVASSMPRERFRFHAGAPLLAPAGLGSTGSICVGTADGYIHLLSPDGSFRWSYSVHGAVVRRPVQSGELWFVTTSAERIYALTAEGTLYWVFRPPSAVASELAVDTTGTTYFVGADHFLYGVTAHGGVSLRAAFGELKAGPVTGPDGAVWAENQAGNLVRARGQELTRLTPESLPAIDFASPDALRDPDGHEWRVRADGALEFKRTPTSAPSLLELTSSPLLSPSWSPTAHFVLVSARDGLVVGVGLEPQTP